MSIFKSVTFKSAYVQEAEEAAMFDDDYDDDDDDDFSEDEARQLISFRNPCSFHNTGWSK